MKLSPPDCESIGICVELRQLDEHVDELAQLAGDLDQGLKLGLSRPSTYLSGCEEDLKPSNTTNHTGAMYDIYSVIPEEKRSLVNSPILQMKAIKNEVLASTI